MTPTRKEPNHGQAHDHHTIYHLRPEATGAQDHGQAEPEDQATEALTLRFYPGGTGLFCVARTPVDRPLDLFSPRF